MRRMRTKATATTAIINVPSGVTRSMALSQNSVPFVELVGVCPGPGELLTVGGRCTKENINDAYKK